jgi:hypothetical protein
MTSEEDDVGVVDWAWDFCQKCLRNNPVIVVGSGASAIYQLPTMKELGEYLVREVERDGIPSGGDDIWAEFKGNLEGSGLEKAIDDATLWRHDELYLLVRTHTWRCIANVDVEVHKLVLSNPNHIALSKLFRHLLTGHEHTATVVTTNYDRLVEYAAEAAGYFVRTGFQSGYLGSWKGGSHRVEYWTDQKRVPQETVEIWKVHGSLDWFLTEDERQVFVPASKEIPVGSRPLIIPPSIRKMADVHDEPFRTTLQRSDEVLQSASGFFCIGYGFNDDHIQVKLLERAISQRKPVVILAKTLTAKSRDLIVGSAHNLKFLALEEQEGHGTRMYSHQHRDGEVIEGHHVWDIRHFVDTVI